MAVLTKEEMVTAYYGNERRRPIAAATKIFKGGLLGFVAGYARELVAGDVFGGLSKENIDNSDGAAGDLKVEVEFPMIEAPVLGATVASVGEPVYAVNDNINDLTLTPGANTLIGTVSQWLASTTCIVNLAEPGTIQP